MQVCVTKVIELCCNGTDQRVMYMVHIGNFSCSGSPCCVTHPNFPFGNCSSSALCPYNKGEGDLHSQGLRWAHDQGLTDPSMLTLGQSVGFLDGLETVDRMGERLELLFDWGLLGGWAVTLELLRIVFATRRGRARMDSQLNERWGVGFSMVSFEYMDPALSAAGVHSWTCELRKLLLSQSSE